MKNYCTKCNHEISKEIEKAIENYECGHIICPHCKTKQKRYLSESDILIYFGITSTFYCLMISILLFIYDLLGISTYSILIACVLFILAYFFLKQVTRFIYEKAPFKQDIKNIEIKEDREAVTKRMRWQFIAFMIVALMMSGEPKLTNEYCFLLIAFIIIIIIKLYLSIKNERNSIHKKSQES